MSYIEQLFETPKHKVGEKYHTQPETGRMLISQGYAKEIRDPSAAATEGDSALGSTHVAFFPKAVWSVAKHPVNGEVHVVKKFCSEIGWFQEPLPSDCPGDVAALYREMVAKNNPGAQFAANERQKLEVEHSMQMPSRIRRW